MSGAWSSFRGRLKPAYRPGCKVRHLGRNEPDPDLVDSMDANKRQFSQEGAMPMDKDRVKGAVTRTGGKIKQAAGDVTGDTKMQTEGKVDQAKGKAQNAMGSAKDALKK
jgi:uncharacterized protein YjbJ (UPF0337 family)